MAKTRTDLIEELAEALKIWDAMNDDIAAMRSVTFTQAQHDLQRQKIDSLVRELEAHSDQEVA